MFSRGVSRSLQWGRTCRRTFSTAPSNEAPTITQPVVPNTLQHVDPLLSTPQQTSPSRPQAFFKPPSYTGPIFKRHWYDRTHNQIFWAGMAATWYFLVVVRNGPDFKQCEKKRFETFLRRKKEYQQQLQDEHKARALLPLGVPDRKLSPDELEFFTKRSIELQKAQDDAKAKNLQNH